MSMVFTFSVTAVVRRESGKFAPRDEVGDQIRDVLEGLDPDLFSLGPDGDSTYTLDDLTVEEVPQPKRARKKVRS